MVSLILASVRYGPKELLRQIGYCMFQISRLTARNLKLCNNLYLKDMSRDTVFPIRLHETLKMLWIFGYPHGCAE